jgi:hypothetical protein
MPRPKRAAAIAAESSIKEHIEEINREDDDIYEESVETVRADQAQRDLNDDLGCALMDDPSLDRSSFNPSKKLRQFYDSRNKEECSEDDGDSILSIGYSSGASEHSIQTLCYYSGSSNFSTESAVISSTMKAQLAHRIRRASRQVNSVGPMRFSGRTRYKMTRGSVESPAFSPIAATRFSFTPIAHLSTTPIFEPVKPTKRCV